MALLTDEETGKREQPHWYWHYQNLYKEKKSHVKWTGWRHGRLWMHTPRRGMEAHLEWSVPTSFAHMYVRFGGNNCLACGFACGLFALWFTIEYSKSLRNLKLFNWYNSKTIDISFYNWAVSWKFWVEPDEWDSHTPKWRHGWFHILDFLLGRRKYTSVEREKHQVELHFLEADYPATVILTTDTWKRPRWHWPLVVERAEVDVPGGVPIPGKGENSWDIDDDATFSLVTPASTVEEAVQKFYDTVNERRARYGGRNWTPEKRVQS